MLSFNVSSCLESVALSDLKKSCCCFLLSRIVVCTTYDSLSLGSFVHDLNYKL